MTLPPQRETRGAYTVDELEALRGRAARARARRGHRRRVRRLADHRPPRRDARTQQAGVVSPPARDSDHVLP
ncbi:hypothetical protein GUJ93_ZPchr0006g46384 [Zizania palustris]|uniref:Uncharacterized protein n=1 Tax=Zizania palustris TaxID=103762 RepID=A0A8J5VVY7_ZIZPA|nr:hypothetical protein GUJ93_ZPchr0006g46384 [Zizania palustris]